MITNKLERKIIAIAIVIISGCISFGFYSDGVTGYKLIITAVIVFALKAGELFFSADFFQYLKSECYYKVFGCGLLVVIFFGLSVTATSFSWYMQPQKGLAKMDSSALILAEAKKARDFAQEQLVKCPQGHRTKCAIPNAAILAEKQAKYDKALADNAKFSEIKATKSTWDHVAGFFGTDRKTLEFGRDFILSALFDLIAIIFFAQSANNNEETGKKYKRNLKSEEMQNDEINNSIFSMPNQREPLSLTDSQTSLNGRSWLDNPENIEETNNAKDGIIDFIFGLPDGKNMIMLGQQGYGKSALLGHLAVEALKRGEDVFVVDPHFNITESAFPTEATIIGKGGNYDEITQFFNKVWAEIERRKREMATVPNASKHWTPITILMDEMTSTVEEAKLGEIFTKAFTQIRKYKGKFLGISHSLDVKSLGIAGKKELLKSFEIFSLSDATNGRVITHYSHDLNGKRIKKGVYKHPGKIEFSHFDINLDTASLNESQDKEDSFQPVFDDIITKENINKTAVLDAVAELGEPTNNVTLQNQKGYTSYRKLTMKVWGKHGSHWNSIVDDVLRGESESV